MKLLSAASVALVLSVASASAGFWKSEDFGCSISLPDSNSATSQSNWSTVGSTEEGTLVGAQRNDLSAFVFLGYEDLSKRPKFHLNEKTIEELEKRFFSPPRFPAWPPKNFVAWPAGLQAHWRLRLPWRSLRTGGRHVRSEFSDLRGGRDEAKRLTTAKRSRYQGSNIEFQAVAAVASIRVPR